MKENNEISTAVSDEKTTKQDLPKTDEPKVRKQLSPEEIQKQKKIMVYLLLILVFIGVMYLIFAPSKAEKETSAFNHS